MDKFRQFLDWLTKSRYTRSLEAEVERLLRREAELTDALLSQAGLAPITKPAMRELPRPKGKLLPSQYRSKLEELAMPKEKHGN